MIEDLMLFNTSLSAAEIKQFSRNALVTLFLQPPVQQSQLFRKTNLLLYVPFIQYIPVDNEALVDTATVIPIQPVSQRPRRLSFGPSCTVQSFELSPINDLERLERVNVGQDECVLSLWFAPEQLEDIVSASIIFTSDLICDLTVVEAQYPEL